MKLSVIIVNYNVEFFLELCLFSVEKALLNIDGEIWVVDNNSTDESDKMLKDKFPDINVIHNKVNAGFAVANNQAILKAKGEYILLLNPDTIVEEGTFLKALTYLEENPNTGGLGVKMIDGKGCFLPESKRGLPTPLVAFYKLFGLAKLFPKSKIFGRYHLGFLDKEKIHEVDVLPGAFMLIPKKVLNEIGLLDERFFMYGEDIDLSYRITKAGYKNIYFPKSNIIHFKGESTKKSSTNYVFIFYGAMLLFAQKHFSNKQAGLFSFLIHIAIYVRAFASLSVRALKKAHLSIFSFYHLLTGITQKNASDSRIAIIGDLKETLRVSKILLNSSDPPEFIGLVNTVSTDTNHECEIGTLIQIEDLIVKYQINELVFCTDCLNVSEIIRQMIRLNKAKLLFKFAARNCTAVIGNQSIYQAKKKNI